MSAFVIKAEVRDPNAATFTFPAQKTIYGGKKIAKGDTVFLISSENSGGAGLIVRGIVQSASPIAKNPELDRQTPRVTVTIKPVAKVKKRLGRAQLKFFSEWDDERPETELNFKLYRQATDKIIGVTEATAAFLHRHF